MGIPRVNDKTTDMEKSSSSTNTLKGRTCNVIIAADVGDAIILSVMANGSHCRHIPSTVSVKEKMLHQSRVLGKLNGVYPGI